jgi:hypothetical protein
MFCRNRTDQTTGKEIEPYSQHEISYTNENQQRLVATLSRMRLLHGAAVVHRSHNSAGKSGHCVAKEVCSEALFPLIRTSAAASDAHLRRTTGGWILRLITGADWKRDRL